MKNESREFEMELELKARVATRDIDDIMCTALEGGITSWCRAAKAGWQDARRVRS